MLKKCLKYDLAAVFRLLWILLIAVFVITIGIGVGMRMAMEMVYLSDYMTEATGTAMEIIIIIVQLFSCMGGYLFAMLCILALGAVLTLGSILVYWRLYSHFFTDQGYLTFTLPVKRSTLYLSKVLTCTLAESALLVAAIAGFTIIFPFIMPTEGFALLDFNYLFKEFPRMTLEAWNFWAPDFSFIWSLIWLSLTPIAFLVIQLASSGLVFLCITLGSTVFKKGKLFASIGIYLLVNGLTYVLMEVLSLPLAIGLAGIMATSVALNFHITGLAVTLTILITMALTACAAAIFHFFNLTLLERKLNLA